MKNPKQIKDKKAMATTVIWMLIAIIFLVVFLFLIYYFRGNLGEGANIIKKLLGGI